MTLTHRSVLNLLAGGERVEAIESDVKRCALWARLSPDKAARDPAEIGAEVIATVMLRWQCILDSDDSITTRCTATPPRWRWPPQCTSRGSHPSR